jgi:2-keto-4-pentenoate hydratase/2-oxohepta-3-ene-1,7-dioic acid hydratase in catechol pathway
MTDTPGRVGLFMKPPTFLQHGDEVAVVIDRIERMSNPLVFES